MNFVKNGKKLGVIGGGAMGSGIAAHAAIIGKLPVNLFVKTEAHQKKSISVINMWIRYFLSKSGTEAQNFAKSLISYRLSYDYIPECEYIIETITEDIDVKKAALDAISPLITSSQIVASNTSCIPITRLASLAKYPEKFIGLHFFNPAPMMKLVEVIPGYQTDKNTIEKTRELVKVLDKQSITCKDVPGFAVNRVLMNGILESFSTIAQGIAETKDVDLTTKMVLDSKFGLMKTHDTVGVHVIAKIAENLIDSFGDDKFRRPNYAMKLFDSIPKK